MLDPLINVLRSFLDILYRSTEFTGYQNYGLAIILLTIIVKTLLFPLTYKQMVSMRRMAELSPKIKELQAKYKATPEKANAAMMEMYKENKVNPFGGCLPMLIQMPVFIGLYQALLRGFDETSNYIFFTMNLNNSGNMWNIYIALLSAGTSFLQTKLSMTNPNDPTAKSMMFIMPIMMGFFTYRVPAGLGLYWVTMNIMSILQQLWINKRTGKIAIEKA